VSQGGYPVDVLLVRLLAVPQILHTPQLIIGGGLEVFHALVDDGRRRLGIGLKA